MKATSMVTLFALLLCTSAGLAQSAAQQSFDALKGLTGEWRGKDTLGHQVEVTCRAISGGSAVLREFMEPSQKEDMVTMFHVDGDRLLLTHYCSAGNQPRMKGILSPDGKTITFDFVDATNLPSPKAGHMRRLVIHILSPDHHTEEWTFVENGKEDTVLSDMQRTKSYGDRP